MSMGTRQRFCYIRGEYGPHDRRVRHVIKQGPASNVALTGPQLLGLGTAEGRTDVTIREGTPYVPDVDGNEGQVLEFVVHLNQGGSRDYRTKEVIVELNSRLAFEGWSGWGSTDEIHWIALEPFRGSRKVFFRDPAYAPVEEGSQTCAGQYMQYQYYRLRYSRQPLEKDQSVKRIFAIPYTTDAGVGVDYMLETDVGFGFGTTGVTGNYLGDPGSPVALGQGFLFIFSLPYPVAPTGTTTTPCSISCVDLRKDDTAALSEELWLFVFRKTAAGWLVVDKQPLSTGNLLPEPQGGYRLFFDIPLGDVQQNDFIGVSGIDARLEYGVAAGASEQYIGGFTAPWKQMQIGNTIPYGDFQTSTTALRVAGCQTHNYFWDDYGQDECDEGNGLWGETDSARATSGVTAYYGEQGPAHRLYIINSATVPIIAPITYTCKKFMIDIATGPKIALATEYTPTGGSTAVVRLEADTVDFPFEPWRAGEHRPRFAVPAPGRGILRVQTDGTSGTITDYFFEWDTLVTGQSALLTNLRWYPDMRCEGEGDYAYEPAVGAVPAGSLFIYVPKHIELSLTDDPEGDWYKAGDEGLPLIFTNSDTGYSPEDGLKYMGPHEVFVRFNLDEVERFQDGRYPIETLAIEAEPISCDIIL